MRAINRFIALVDARTTRDVERARDHNAALSAIQIGILLAIVLVGIAALVILTRIVLRPLARLTAATRRIAGGDYAQRVDIRSVSDLERVAGSFNEMAAAIETDIAARERAEHDAVVAREAAEHANRAKSTFLAAMSHEMRTPMIGVTGMLEVLARSELSPSQRQMVATADGSARSLLQIVGDILDFSKIEADKLELSPTTIDLREVIGSSVETFVHTASTKGLLLTWSVDERLAPRARRRSAAAAADHQQPALQRGEVHRGGRHRGRGARGRRGRGATRQHIEISVADTGIGIAPEQQARLFAEFAQAQSSTSQRYGGTGLGLVICKRLAVLMGGDMTMRSTPGEGTTVTLTLPLAIGDPASRGRRSGPAAGAPALAPAAHARGGGARGQPPAARRGPPGQPHRAVLQLDTVGFQVDTAVDGEDGYERFLSGDYALVLTDLNMPRMDGFELAEAIRAHERETGAAPIPIIALTASVMQGEPEKCRAAGMDDFAAKPTTIPFLAGRLRRWLPHLDWPAPAMPEAPQPPVAGTVGGEAIDPSVLEELTGGDAELAAEVLDEFLTTTRADIEALGEAGAAHGADDVRRLAHRIRGAARAVGAQGLADVAQRAESLAALGSADWERFAILRDELTEVLDEVSAAVRS